MHRIIRTFNILLLVGALSGAASCGFLHNPRVGKAYADTAFFESSIDSCTGALITWPLHVVIFAVTSIIDQTIHTVEAVPWAGLDAWDYFKLKGNGNNVMLERTIAVPKTIFTPIVFVGSYIVRWLFPLGDDRVFQIEEDKPVNKPSRPAPKEAPKSDGPAPRPAPKAKGTHEHRGLFPARRACTPRPAR